MPKMKYTKIDTYMCNICGKRYITTLEAEKCYIECHIKKERDKNNPDHNLPAISNKQIMESFKELNSHGILILFEETVIDTLVEFINKNKGNILAIYQLLEQQEDFYTYFELIPQWYRPGSQKEVKELIDKHFKAYWSKTTGFYKRKDTHYLEWY